MTVAIFWRGSLYLLFCKYRDKKCALEQTALPGREEESFYLDLFKLLTNLYKCNAL